MLENIKFLRGCITNSKVKVLPLKCKKADWSMIRLFVYSFIISGVSKRMPVIDRGIHNNYMHNNLVDIKKS